MKLHELLYRVKITSLVGSTNIEIANINFDSRQIKTKDLFVAIKGKLFDGHQYIDNAIRDGAKAIIVEKMPTILDDNVSYIQVDNSQDALALVAANFYGNPSDRITLIGVTGTNGKTTIVSLLYQLFSLLEKKVGMLSTIENKIIDKQIPSTHTTPDPLQINYLLNQMIEKGCVYCFMEVSSHALVQGRVHGLRFDGGVFTNLTQDHLDYHSTFSEYRDVKKSFFDCLNHDAFALVNKDDKHWSKMLEGTKAKKITYALKSMADYRTKVLENQLHGMLLKINKIDVWVKLIGDFNAYNILAVYCVAKQFELEDYEVMTALSMLNTAEGRFQFIKNTDLITGIVDYAHTDDALKNVLNTINKIRTNNEALITVVGCGGDRDKSKRPFIAKVACDLSTHVIITSDNPRSESPDVIIKDMVAGLNSIQKKKVMVIIDRKQAIVTAGKLANKNDIILLAGKGHEKYQEINGKKLPFDDMQELKQSLNII